MKTIAADNTRESIHFKPIQSLIPTLPGQVLQNSQGDLLHCACETYPIHWRLEEAITLIKFGSIRKGLDLLSDIHREIAMAEALAIPMPHVDMASVKMEVI